MKELSQKIIAVTIVIILLCSCIIPVCANQYDSENGATGNITALENGFTDISFSNGYTGYCIDRYKKGAEINQAFTDTESTEYATNNITGSDISQKLKILFTQCFETIFTADSNGGYMLDPSMESPVSFAVYHFTGEQDYIWQENKALVQAVNAYSGSSIPDHGYQLELYNGNVITFDFTVISPNNANTHQCFFAYRINTEHTDPHKHSYSEAWSSDDTSHWNECECGEKTNEDFHVEEIRNQVNPGEFTEGYTGDTYCKVCDKLLEQGKTIPQTHKHTYPEAWKSDDDQHWQECKCGDKTNEDSHVEENRNHKDPAEFEEGYTGDTYCKICNKLLDKGEVIAPTHKHTYPENWKNDENGHWKECKCGNKSNEGIHIEEIRDPVDPGEFQEGYTGDTYCKTCNKLLAEGKVIPPTHKHSFSEEWKKDEDNHWKECKCGAKYNETPHVSETRNRVEPDEFAEGYSGDTYCKVCDKLLKKGESIPQTHKHSYPDTWKSNDNNHWHECVCSNKADEALHEEEIRNYAAPGEFQEGYTGDIYCKICEKLLKKGKVIPQTHKHFYPDTWMNDEENHWRECKCGDKQDLAKHKGNIGNCVNKPICDTCENPFGTIDKNNHTGNIEIRNVKEATTDEAGYTGDTYCKDCNDLLKNGEIIPPKPMMPSEPQETTPPATEPTVKPSDPGTEPTLPSEPIEETNPTTEPIQPATKPEIPQETQTLTTPITSSTSSSKLEQTIPETGDAANIVPFVILVFVSVTMISIITPKLWTRRKSK